MTLRFRSPTIALLVAALSAAAGAAVAPPAKEAIRPLDPSIPEQALIIRWHHDLLVNDYEDYRRIAFEMPPGRMQVTPQMQRAMFDSLRKNVPPKILIGTPPVSINPNGSRTYVVLGCTRLPGDARDIRLLSEVTTNRQNGKDVILGTGFGPPWTDLARVCPVTPT